MHLWGEDDFGEHPVAIETHASARASSYPLTPVKSLSTHTHRHDSVLIPRVSSLCRAEINLIFIISVPELIFFFIWGDKKPNQFRVWFSNNLAHMKDLKFRDRKLSLTLIVTTS